MHAFLTFLRLFIKCFLTISDFLFSKFCLFLSCKIQSFSSNYRFDPPIYEIDCFNTDQVMSNPVYYLSVSKYISKVLCHLSTFCG